MLVELHIAILGKDLHFCPCGLSRVLAMCITQAVVAEAKGLYWCCWRVGVLCICFVAVRIPKQVMDERH